MVKHSLKHLLAFIFLFPLTVLASESYDLKVTMPVFSGDSEGETKLGSFTFNTWYSQLESRVSSITWDPCQSFGQTTDCRLINPLKAANIVINIYAFNATDIKHLDSCYIDIDFSNYRALPDPLQQSLDSKKPIQKLLNLAIEGIEQNTAGSDDYMDCVLRLKGAQQHADLSTITIPRYLYPLIPSCQTYTAEGHQRAIAINDKGMEHYANKQWQQAAAAFREAAAQDCNYFIARSNLASVLALKKQFVKARAVLWRSYQMDAKLTMKKLENDSDYRLLKQDVNFYSGASPIGVAYRDHCYAPQAADKIYPGLAALIKQSKLKQGGKAYTVASQYVFKADFNKNGLADMVFPLVQNHLSSLLVVFDGNKLDAPGCTSTPLQPYDLAGAYKDDPCNIKIFAGAQGSKRGLRLETDHIAISRMICQ